jgi:hypothetical protein
VICDATLAATLEAFVMQRIFKEKSVRHLKMAALFAAFKDQRPFFPLPLHFWVEVQNNTCTVASSFLLINGSVSNRK